MLWIDKNGGDSKTVKWVEMPDSSIGAAAGQVRVLGAAQSTIGTGWAVSVWPGPHRWDPALIQPVIELAARYNAIPHAFPAKEMYFTS